MKRRNVKKSVIFKYYFLRKAHGTEHQLSGTHFTDEYTEAMRIRCLAQGHNILMLSWFEPSTSVSRNRHPNQITIMVKFEM